MSSKIAEMEHTRILREIAEHGKSILRPIDEELIEAVKCGDFDGVMSAIDNGADIEAKQWGGFYFFTYVISSPMVEAVRSGNWDMIQLLRTYGAMPVDL